MIAGRIEKFDWVAVAHDLDRQGWSPLPRLPTADRRDTIAAWALRCATSDTRSPAPYATPSAARYLMPGAASSSFATSSTLSTAGSLLGTMRQHRPPR